MAFMAPMIPYLLAAGAAVSAYGAISQGQAAKASGKFNAAMNEQNAQFARQEAEALARQQDRENFMRIGAIKAAQGKSGGAAGEGSVLDVIGSVAEQGELERQMIIYRGELKASGYQSTAALDTMSGGAASTAGYLTAGSELLKGGATSSYYSQPNSLTRT